MFSGDEFYDDEITSGPIEDYDDEDLDELDDEDSATPPVDCPRCHRTLYWCRGH